MMSGLLRSMIPAMLDQQRKARPDMSDATAEAFSSTVIEVMDGYTAKILSQSADLYAEVLSEDELVAMVDFYEGATGRSLTEKVPALTTRSTQLVMAMMPEITAAMAERFCQKTGCKGKATRPKAS